MENQTKKVIVNRSCHMRYNKRTGTYSVVRGTSYVKTIPIKPEILA